MMKVHITTHKISLFKKSNVDLTKSLGLTTGNTGTVEHVMAPPQGYNEQNRNVGNWTSNLLSFTDKLQD